MSPSESDLELRKSIKTFNREPFNTSEIRAIHNGNNLLSKLDRLSDAGEIERVGIERIGTKRVDVWREKCLIMSETLVPQWDVLPGWRDVFPLDFADMAMPWQARA